MELDMWIITLITFCVILTENIDTLVRAIKNDGLSFFFSVSFVAMLGSISMIITSIIQICILT